MNDLEQKGCHLIQTQEIESHELLSSNENYLEHGYSAKAWIAVLGGFLVVFNTWGVTDSYGAYQTFYESGSLFSASSSSISWIGSTQSSLLLILGLITGPLYDLGYFQSLVYTGSFFTIFGQMMLSVCNEYYQVFLAQGVCIGIGTGMVFVPGITILSSYFDQRVELANGIATAGGGVVGGIVYPIMLHKLAARVGFAWCVRAIGSIMFITLLIQLAAFRDLPQPTRTLRRDIFDWSAFKEPAYVVFLLGGTITSISIDIPNYYIQIYAIENHITSGEFGFYLLSVITAGSVCGRLCLNILAEKVGPFNVLSLSIIVCGVLSFALINVESMPGLIIMLIIYGFFSGAFTSLPPPCFVKLSPNQALVGTRMGMGYAAITIGNLVGAPIAGAIRDNWSSNSMWGFSGIVSIGGGLVIVLSRCFKGGWRIWVKV
ncbi:hypothetical protein BBP40_002750 [Aspergillus hancockii]|nr:hypothetical protein BBP40_002750 [Aspergillus hancockii]